MRRKGPKENMKKWFILIKFEKLQLIEIAINSISPFYQILFGPIEARDRSRATCRHRAEELLEGWWASRHILILTLPRIPLPSTHPYPCPYPYPSGFGLPPVPSSLPIFGRVPGTILALLWPCWPRVVAWDPYGVLFIKPILG